MAALKVIRWSDPRQVEAVRNRKETQATGGTQQPFAGKRTHCVKWKKEAFPETGAEYGVPQKYNHQGLADIVQTDAPANDC